MTSSANESGYSRLGGRFTHSRAAITARATIFGPLELLAYLVTAPFPDAARRSRSRRSTDAGRAVAADRGEPVAAQQRTLGDRGEGLRFRDTERHRHRDRAGLHLRRTCRTPASGGAAELLRRRVVLAQADDEQAGSVAQRRQRPGVVGRGLGADADGQFGDRAPELLAVGRPRCRAARRPPVRRRNRRPARRCCGGIEGRR